jgi:Xaa-Pro dipeptidase
MSEAKAARAFETTEYAQRLERVRRRMEAQGISLLLVDTPENITYLTGMETPGYYMYMAAVVPARGDLALVLRRAEMANARTTSWTENLIPYDDTVDPLKLVADEAKRLADKGKIGVEMDSSFLTVNRFRRLASYLGRVEVIDAAAIITEERRVKSPREVEMIRRAARIVSDAMKQAVATIQPGRNENEVAASIFNALVEGGSGFLAMEPFVSSGPRTGSMHAVWAGRAIQNDEPVLIEVGGCVHRYHAALMRTVLLGSPSKELLEWGKVAVDALDAVVAKIRPGITSGEADAACRGVIEKAGLYENFRKRTGYSIGLAYAPDWGEGHFLSLQRDDPNVLVPGMTFHMPPALREYGKYGFGVSETIVVTERGCEILTQFPERLIRK